VVEIDFSQLDLSFPGQGFQCVAASSARGLEALEDGYFSFTLVDLRGNGTDVRN